MKGKVAKKRQGAHVAPTKFGMGDFYGTGIKNKTGKMISGIGVNAVTPKKLRTPPKSVA